MTIGSLFGRDLREGQGLKLHIQRYRWIIVRDRKEIFCGLAQDYQFKNIDDIGSTAIKTYSSEQKARYGFLNSWGNAQKLIDAGRVEFVQVIESLGTQEFFKWLKGEKA